MSCIFCRLISRTVPSFTLMETETAIAILDVNPISSPHILLIPKFHCTLLHQLPDTATIDILPMAKQLMTKLKIEQYNLLQNNGPLAHQEVGHVHFHLIPKNHSEGLELGWNLKQMDKGALEALHSDLLQKLAPQ